jgi:hypothetical protein
VKADHDFTADEEFTRRQETWAKNSAALQERWRKRIKFELLFEKINDVKPDAAIKRLSGRYSRIQERSQALNFEERATVFMSDMAKTFDRNSAYLSPSDLEWFRGGFIRFLTIGVTIRSERGEFVIADPLPVYGSAGRHGVNLGDIVTGIGTLDNTKFFDITEMSNWDLTGLMRREFARRQLLVIEVMQPGSLVRRRCLLLRFYHRSNNFEVEEEDHETLSKLFAPLTPRAENTPFRTRPSTHRLSPV